MYKCLSEKLKFLLYQFSHVLEGLHYSPLAHLPCQQGVIPQFRVVA